MKWPWVVTLAPDHYCGSMSMSASPADNNDQTSIDAIEKDLADVEAALARLEAGTYWTDEVTGQPIPVEVLNRNPLARRKD